MKMLFTTILLLLLIPFTGNTTDQGFNTALQLLKPITISKVQDLLIPDTTLTGADFNVVVSTSDSGAVTFNARGSKNRNITRSVMEPSIELSAPGVAGKISVDTFIVAGPTIFDESGNANGVKIGATAHVLATSESGDYSGIATLRVVYQ